jgi:hypothetical protein
MWDKLLSKELVFYMIEKTGNTEDFNSVNGYIEHMKARVGFKNVVVVATQWHKYDDMKQANIAIHFAGIFHASRFCLMMDYLSELYLKGELK